jgi:hypothetical protein
MGFGSNQARAADADLAQRLRADVSSAAADGDNDPRQSPPQPASAAPTAVAPVTAQPPAVAGAFRPGRFTGTASTPQPAPAQSPPAPQGRPSARQSFGASAPQPSAVASSRPATFGPPPGASTRPPVTPVFNRAVSEHGESPRTPAPINRIPARLERLIEEVGIYRLASPAAIAEAKRNSLKDPAAARTRFEKIYADEILPLLEKSAADIASARAKYPDSVVFMITRGKQQRLQSVERQRAQASGLDILDGASILSFPASSTPFPAPAELFGVGAGIVSNQTRQDTAAPEPARGPRP